jgi:beta-glucosidase
VDAPHARANEELRGFQRITLQPGEKRELTFTITPRKDLRYYNEQHSAYEVDNGRYEVQVGASSSDVRLSQPFRVRF